MEGPLVECFGRMRIVERGVPSPIRGRRQQHLLAALVLARGDGLSVTQVLDELYDENLPLSREEAARMAVKRLRGRLGGHVEHDGSVYRLCLADDAVDVWAFADAVDRGLEPMETLELWSGALFPGVELSPGADLARQALERARLRALEALAWEVDMRAAAPIGLVVRAARAHLDQEDLVGATAAALYRCGRQTDALALMADARSELMEGFGVSPTRAFESIELAILNHDQAALAARRAGAASPSPATRGASPFSALREEQTERFYGRRKVRGRLTSLIGAARRGPGRLVLITGEAGAGKTTLVNRLAEEARLSGFDVCAGSAGLASAVAYAPMLEALPELRDCLDTLADATDPETGRLLFCRDVEARISARRQHQELLLVLEDIHEIDAQSAHLLRYLTSVSLPAGVAMVLTRRPQASTPSAAMLMDALQQRSRVQESLVSVMLEPLDRDAIFQLVSHDHPTESVARRMRLAAYIEAQSGGNALVASLMSRHAPAGLAVGAVDLNASAVRLVDQRLSGVLRSDTMKVMAAAALIGPEFDLTRLAQLLDTSLDNVADAVGEAVTAGVVSETNVEDRFAFCHALMAAACEEHLIARRRRQLCTRLAQLAPTDLDHVVRYVRGAGNSLEEGRAVALLLDTGGALQAAFAHAQAAEAFELAVRRMSPDDERLLPALIDQASCVAQIGQPSEANALRSAAFDRAVELDRLDLVPRIAMSGLDGGETLLGDRGRLAMFERIELEALEPFERERTIARWIRHERITGNVDRARQLVEEHHDAGPLVDVEHALLDVFSTVTSPCAGELARITEAHPHHPELPFIRHRQLWAALVEQDDDAPTTLFDEVWLQVRETGHPNELWSMQVLDATLSSVGLRTSGTSSATALEAGLRLGNPNATDTWMGQIMMEALLAGTVGDTADLGLAAIGEAPSPGRRIGLATALHDAGRIDEARQMMIDALGDLRMLEHSSEVPTAAALLAELAFALDAPDAAAESIRWLRSRSGQAVLLGIGAGYLGPADRYLALAEKTLGNRSAAAHYAESAVDQASRVGSRHWIDRSQDTLGVMQ